MQSRLGFLEAVMVAKQGTEEWLKERAGKATASRFGDVMTEARSGGGLSKTAMTYMIELLCERLTGKPMPNTIPQHISDWGHEHEPHARALYQFYVGERIEQTGLIIHKAHPSIGGSPDGLVGTDGAMEIKCPHTVKAHLEVWEAGGCTEKDYLWQCQGNLWISERKWIDYVSYHPSLPENLQLFVKRYERDEDMIDDLESKVVRFIEQLEIREAKMRAIKGVGSHE